MRVVRRSLLAVAAAGLGLALVTPGASADESSHGTPSAARPMAVQPAPAISRGLIVKTTTSTPSKSLVKSADAALGSEAEAVTSKRLTGKISTVAFDQSVPETVAQDAANQVAKRSDVEWAMPNTLRQATTSPPVAVNDPLSSHQRYVWDTTYSNGGYSVKAPSLWQKTRGSSDVVVAVVDTGVLPDHPDLGGYGPDGQLVPGYDMISADHPNAPTPTYEMAGDDNGRDDDPSDPGDWTERNECGAHQPRVYSSWHGTFIAGMIAAKADNHEGVVGIAPRVKVEPVRVLGHCGGWDDDIIAGVTWASGGHVDGVPDNLNPAQVINLSLGYTYPHTTAGRAGRAAACSVYSAVFDAARNRGSVIVAAAGNDASYANLSVPSSCSHVISVGSTSLRGFSAWYSNMGSSVDISAPGGDRTLNGNTDTVLSLSNGGVRGPRTDADGYSYTRYQGTSMSTAEVSAGAALLYSVGLDTPAEVEAGLLASVFRFHAPSSRYAKKKIQFDDGSVYYFDLNCSGHDRCGDGILDLSKVQAPLGRPTIIGTPTVGEPLSVEQGGWVATPAKFRYTWLRGDEPVGTSSTYLPTQGDVGSTLSVRVAPYDSEYASLSAVSEPSGPVPDRPPVVLSIDAETQATYGKPFVVNVASENENGMVQIRRGTGTVMAAGTLTGGHAEITIPGSSLVAGTYPIRAAYLGGGSTSLVSSTGVPLTVAKAKSTVTTSLASSVRTSSHATLRVTINVTGDPKPTGILRVYDVSDRLLTTKLSSSSNGKRTISLPRLRKGHHSIKVYYYPNSNIAASHSHYEHITAY